MNKVAHYLQQHLNGEILTSDSVLRYFSTDGSILKIRPQLVVYPRSESDIRKIARFTWQLAEKGRAVPVTVRGMGTDQTGASIGEGIIIVMPAHMNKIVELDSKTGVVTVEAGASLDKIQQVLHTHGRFLPPVSLSNLYSTVGGAVANNDAGRSSYKYGPMQEFVRGLRVVLANGELIETGRISKRELNKKLGLASFEGEIYRTLDKLIEESQDSITSLAAITFNSSAGYNLADVKQKDGSFDLSPLFLGAQGTLGIITEVIFETLPYNPTSTLIVAGLQDKRKAWHAVEEINKMKEGPACIDFVDASLLRAAHSINPAVLKPLEGAEPEVLLFFEMDDKNTRSRKKIQKKITKVLESNGAEVITPEGSEIDTWERLRDVASLFLTYTSGKKQALPILDDVYVPVAKMAEFFERLDSIMTESSMSEFAAWGQAGSGMVHIAPLLDLSSVGDRQKLFKVMDAFYGYVCSIGGSVSGECAEGRTGGLFNERLFRPEGIELLKRVKAIFDPMATLNPGVKIGVEIAAIKPMIRDSYSLEHQYSYLPR